MTRPARSLSPQWKAAYAYLRENLLRDNRRNWGASKARIVDVANSWMDDTGTSAFRWEEQVRMGFANRGPILDMASGCGTFVFGGLVRGFDVYGVEPELWKHRFNHLKAAALQYPGKWMSRCVRAVGERLPWKDGAFRAVSSYQTLEHVNDVRLCLSEMLRVLRPGGRLFLYFPDYRSTFEGHYRIPWLPLFPKALARRYLKVLGRPMAGLDSLHYVTEAGVKKTLLDLDPSLRFADERGPLKRRLRFLRWVRALTFSRELSGHLVVQKPNKPLPGRPAAV